MEFDQRCDRFLAAAGDGLVRECDQHAVERTLGNLLADDRLLADRRRC